MDRRRFALLSLVCTLGIPPLATAQPPQKVSRIGILFPGFSNDPSQRNVGAFKEGLRDLGYRDGRDVAIEVRYAEGSLAALPRLVDELLSLKLDVLVTVASRPTQAAKEATHTVPIVMADVGNPVAAGFAKSLARPGGNLTGVSALSEELSAKRLELLKEALPKVSRIGVLFDPTHPTNRVDLRRCESVAQALHVSLRPIGISRREDFDAVFSQISRDQVEALVVLVFEPAYVERAAILRLLAKYRLPTIYPFTEGAEGGALMSYGVDFPQLYRRAASYVVKILKGAKPADLPIEQPTKFELVVNLKTAKALGLTIPPSLLSRADHVIE